MTTSPLISIILPIYNSNAKWLTLSLESILSQSYTNFELIVINDASTNSIGDTVSLFLTKDKRIKYIYNKKSSKGIYTNILNQWISLAQGEYIARMDDDDIRCDPDKLKKQINFMESHKDVFLCGTSVINIDESWKEISRTNVPEHDNDIRNRLMRFNQFAHASIIFRKALIQEVRGYNPLYDGAEDYEFWLRIWSKYEVANLSDYCLKYRYNTQWISSKKRWKQWWYGITIAYKYRKYYPWFWKYIVPRFILLIIPRNLLVIILRIIKNK